MPERRRRIIISDEQHGLPYSKGWMARSIMATGVHPSIAFEIARLIEEDLEKNNIEMISRDELAGKAVNAITEEVGTEYADKYVRWQELKRLDKPLIILIGGGTGVGKSTIASEVAHRLGINRLISTDALREVMRVMLSEELMPALYHSSFEAYKYLRNPAESSKDAVLIGFREQTAAVSVSVKAIIDRAIKEQINMVIEGVHLVPGYFDLPQKTMEQAFIIPIVISVPNDEAHRSHFYLRDVKTTGFRSYSKYLDHFGDIRKISAYIDELCKQRSITNVQSYNLDRAVAQVLEEIIRLVL